LFVTVLLPLRQLKSVSLDAYEKVWKHLDKRLEGTKKEDFRNVAEEFMFAREEIENWRRNSRLLDREVRQDIF